MIVDTSALVAIINGEPEARRFSELLAASMRAQFSAASYLETAIVVDREMQIAASALIDEMLENYDIRIVAVSEGQARLARAAYNKYGKGMGHAAQLNYGDCFVYALAKEADEPLLFKGNDFVHTDVRDASKL